MRTFCSEITGLDEESMPEFALDGQVPGLRVRGAIVFVDGEGVRNLPRYGGSESVHQRERVRQAVVDVVRSGERRLLRELERERVVGLAVVINAVSRAND